MKTPSLFLSVLLLSLFSFDQVQDDVTVTAINNQAERIAELDHYWATLAKTASEGDFDRMQSMYHQDAVLVKPDTTISINEAFKYRWKKEIMEVKNGKRSNALEFRFSKRIGNEITAFEEGIFHYTSIDPSTGKTLGDSYIYFEALLVKSNDQWLTTMEYQKTAASIDEWRALNAN